MSTGLLIVGLNKNLSSSKDTIPDSESFSGGEAVASLGLVDPKKIRAGVRCDGSGCTLGQERSVASDLSVGGQDRNGVLLADSYHGSNEQHAEEDCRHEETLEEPAGRIKLLVRFHRSAKVVDDCNNLVLVEYTVSILVVCSQHLLVH
jgi:hypothetical protein